MELAPARHEGPGLLEGSGKGSLSADRQPPAASSDLSPQAPSRRGKAAASESPRGMGQEHHGSPQSHGEGGEFGSNGDWPRWGQQGEGGEDSPATGQHKGTQTVRVTELGSARGN